MSTSSEQVNIARSHFSTFTEVLRWRASRQPYRPIYTFLSDGIASEDTLNYYDLDRKARAIAATLQDMSMSGERALLLYPSGLEYIAAFFGCLYANVVAVPAYPLRSERMLPRLLSIVADAKPAVALTTTSLLPVMGSLLSESSPGLSCVGTTNLDERRAEYWKEPALCAETLALLQYTSGSTASPKGVVLSHGNLIHNSKLISRAYDTDSESRGVSWLPPYHDMGLIGQILMPIYVGAWMALMSPGQFLQRPYRWLSAVSSYRVTHSGAPNFAYDLCVKKITPEQRETLDLSLWRVAFCGAEPIRHDTLDRFTETFAPCGFRRRAFYSCYGLAEATLMVSCLTGDSRSPTMTVDADELERNLAVETTQKDSGARTLVSTGRTVGDQKIIIVNPDAATLCKSGEVGEIWVSGASVAQGYWEKPEETAYIFNAYLADTGDGPFLRTRDLGFLRDGELFVTGRLSDLLIILGRNLYPQDIELTVERSHESLRTSCGAAFLVVTEDESQLVVVQELEFRQKPDPIDVLKAVRRNVATEHGVQLHSLILVNPGSIPKTSSGKVRRNACKAAFLAGTLEVYTQTKRTTQIVAAQDPPLSRGAPNRTRVPEQNGGILLNTIKPGKPTDLSRPSPPVAGVIEASARFQTVEQRIALLVVIAPFLGSIAALVLLLKYGVGLVEVGLLVVMYFIGALGIEVGFHRLFSHRAFQTKPFIRAMLAIFGSMNAQGPILFWAAIHRRHHQYSDHEGDPHSPHLLPNRSSPLGLWRGLWHAHAGWLFVHEITDWNRYVPDLLSDRVVFEISRYYLVWPIVGLVVPALAGALLTRSWLGLLNGVLWGGFVRIFLAQQVTWGVNSIGHVFGRRPFPLDDRSANNAWLALPSAGGSWHNNHHAFPSSAWHGLKWWQIDLAGYFISALAATGLAWKVELPTQAMIAAKVEMEFLA